MTCQDFQREWNELLDAEASGALATGPGLGVHAAISSIEETEALLLAHAAACPACRPIAARYQTLRRAIRAWRRPQVPSADLVDRILAAQAGDESPTVRSGGRFGLGAWPHRLGTLRIVSGLAAAVLVALGLATGIHRIARGPEADRGGPARGDLAGHRNAIPGVERAPGAPPALDRALAEATSATWDLARSASEPAARISREVLDVTVRNGDEPADGPARSATTEPARRDGGLAALSVSVPSLGADAAGASDVLRQVGDQVSAGVEPLSSSARHAFGFLLGSPSARAGGRPGQSTSTGARSG